MTRPFATVLAVVLLAAAPARARAQVTSDPEAPSGAVATDGRTSHWWLSVRADLVSPFFGAWGGTVEVAPCPWVSVGVTPSYVSRDTGTGLALDATLRVWPLGHGVDGPFVGVVGGAQRTTLDDAATLALDVGGDLGWQIVWSGPTITLSAGGGWVGVVDGPVQQIEGPVVRARVELGWSWR